MTVTTVRPNSTDSNVNVATSGAVTAFTVLSDTNNATIAQATAHRGTLRLGLPSTTVSSTTRLMRARIGLVYAHEGVDVGHPEQVNYRFRDPTLNAYGPDASAAAFSATFPAAGSPLYGPWNNSAPDGAAWDQARIDRLQTHLFWLASIGGQFLKVSELYVQYETNTQPTVSGVTVTGATVTTRPSFTWTYADTENDPQVVWRAKAFTAAQYGAAGFDPATSASVWDSGVVLGDAAAGTVGADLVNGVTYEVFVTAAQSWPGPEGAYWYSPWVASAPFTVALSPPLTPALTVSTQTVLPAYRVLLNVTAPINLLTSDEADFEVAIGGWVADVNCAVVRSTTNPASGLADLQLTATALGTMSARTASGTSGKPVLPGTTYTCVGSFRTAVTGRSCNVLIRWYDRVGGLLSTSTGGTVTDTTVGYTQATLTAAAPANAVFATAVAQVASAAASEVHRVDLVSLHAGTSTTWSPGGLQSTAALVVERAEKVTNFRGPAVNWAHPQLASGGAVTRGSDGFYSRVAGLLSSQPLDGPPMTGAAGAAQARMIVWRPTTGAFAFLDWGLDNNATTDPTPPYLAPAVVGLQTRLACWARVRSGTFSSKLFAFSVDPANSIVTTASSTISLTTAWQRFTVDITPAAGSCYLRGGLEDTAGATEQDVTVTGIRWCPTTLDDGTTPAGQGIQGLWVTVRPVDTPAPGSPGETFALYDHEVPPDRPVLYRATTQAQVTGQTIASVPTTPLGVYLTAPLWALLKDPFQPENALLVYRMPADTAAYEEDGSELHAAGRDADPIITRDWRSGEKGTLGLHLFGDQDLYRLRQLVPSARTLLVQWSVGGQTYVRVTDQSITRVRNGYATATLGYTEQARP